MYILILNIMSTKCGVRIYIIINHIEHYVYKMAGLNVHTLWEKSFHRKNRSAYFMSATPCTIKLKLWSIAFRILILTTISRIFSLIVQGAADRNKRCGSS